ncbi:MAG TPA: AMP-binding protein, partial [Candidatus Binataceae bacterium]|nr:AMP-binding protein [Candidatus Binataceae bacterium]
MHFLENIFERLKSAGDAPVLQEIHAERVESVSGNELLALVGRAQGFIASVGLKKGDRCALLGPNSIRWVAADLALMAEGVIVVPLYARQAASELVTMMKDCSPARLLFATPELRDSIATAWPGAPPTSLFNDIFASAEIPAASSASAGKAEKSRTTLVNQVDPITIIYTSGTSGEPKGVVLNVGNLDHMMRCTTARLDRLMEMHPKVARREQIFHYLPLNFAASWLTLLSALSRNAILSLSTDLNRLADEIKIAQPDYFLNVPTLLERIRARIEGQMAERGGLIFDLFNRAKAAFARRQSGAPKPGDGLWLALGNAILFRTIRRAIGPNLKALICGSAPLSIETQRFFMMLGIPVLQAYGLTETTGICTLDDPQHFTPGFVGPAIPGIEMRVGENSEILVRGPNIFAGYWQRPEATAKALEGGWFHTGDQGEVNAEGNWRIIGRVKNLIILNSGHNIAPEPIEEELKKLVPAAEHVVLVGNNRSYLAAIFASGAGSANGLYAAQTQEAVDRVNQSLPHYRQIRAFCVSTVPFSIENGLLTANGKLKRDVITER